MVLTRRRASSAAAGGDGAGGTPSASKGHHQPPPTQQPPIPESEDGATAQKARTEAADKDERRGFIGAKPLLLGAVM